MDSLMETIINFRKLIEDRPLPGGKRHLYKADLLSRIDRRIREKVSPQIRDVLVARRERMQRNNRHRLNGRVDLPSFYLSSRLRKR